MRAMVTSYHADSQKIQDKTNNVGLMLVQRWANIKSTLVVSLIIVFADFCQNTVNTLRFDLAKNTVRWLNVILKLGKPFRRWTSIETTLRQFLVFVRFRLATLKLSYLTQFTPPIRSISRFSIYKYK